ncbi:DUF3455 domain-containing protein [Pandoraea sputorum]|uniref:DUF3455 domain-containing protein n=1 Tax=Pandoraea sputorum TaxID=93222 RepID=UPI0012402DE5|nr:DUF3455 domain-containing protein [Pandoraea sputorum]BET13438.1 DUF3455 domain-containing protein [Pandoraea sputorum]VVE82376.1 hypothetical protein PSP31120_03603 [Pandoraea sputorum]
MKRIVFVSLAAPVLLGACAANMSMPGASAPVADAVKVPDGHRVALQTVGKGDILYECREKKEAMGQFEWTFVGPDAVLTDRSGNAVGKYYGPPATWESSDGSKVTATQVAVSPAGSGNIPLQLVKANPATGTGAMQGVAYIQRLATQGGTAPTSQCSLATKGAKQTVKYQADYIFWKAS